MTSLFSYNLESFKFDKDKKIRLFEAFSGIGTQHMALKRLGLDVELVGISEIDKFAIKSYEAIHGKVKNYGGIGSFDRFPKDIDICTWSFPCQDISLAGTQGGMKDGTQSNYGYVFLDTIKNTPLKERPKVLVMENVKALFGSKFNDDWLEIQRRLKSMGYANYDNVMVATDYGIPQTRERVFIVSILGDYRYNFPKPFELEYERKDFLEKEVDEKYFLSDNMINLLLGVGQKKSRFNRKEVFERSVLYKKNDYANTITTRSGSRPGDNFVITNYKIEDARKVYEKHGKDAFLKKKNNIDIGIENLKIRKLTPLETWRLMGIKDEDFHKAQKSGVSDSQLFKQAGNAIVVDVLYYLFKELF